MEDVARIVENGMGLDAFKNLAASLPEVGVKYNKRIGLLEMFLNMINAEDLKKLQAGEALIKIEAIIRSLFDSTGRVIPPRGFKPKVKDENNNFCLNQIEINFKDCLKRMQEYLPGYKFSSLLESQDKYEAVKKKALQHSQIGPNAFKRCSLFLPIPHIPELADLKKLHQVFNNLLEAVKRAYENEFSKDRRVFKNYRRGILQKNVLVVSGTRHKKLLDLVVKAPQVGILLPNSLQGYSIIADRKIISLFPKFVSLVGIEYILAMIGYSDILARGWNISGLNLSAIYLQNIDSSFFFKAYDSDLIFDCIDNLFIAHNYFSGGLFLS